MPNSELRNLTGIEGYITAIQAMIDGLFAADRRADFVIDMATYGSASDTICYGCAATCALQQITNCQLTHKTIYCKGQYLDDDIYFIRRFESAIDSFREGISVPLQVFCGVHIPPHYHTWHLTTSNWKQEIYQIQEYVQELRITYKVK